MSREMEVSRPTGWAGARLGDVVAPVKRVVAEPPSNVLTISSTRGFVPQDEKWGRFMAGKSLAKYVELQQGEFAYNRGNSLTYPQGCIYRLADWDSAAVPFVYFCFRVSSPGVAPEFLDHYFRAGGLNAQLGRLINTGVRNNGLLNIREGEFFNVRVPLPPLREQRRIAAMLQAVDDAIVAGEAVVEQLDRVRRDLIEDLLRNGLPARHGNLAETPLGSLPAAWTVVPLGELAEVERGKFTHRPRGDPRLYGGPYPFIQTGDVTACGGRIDTFSQTLNEDGLAVSRLFPAGTVVVTIAANVGETGVAEFDVAFPDSLVGIRCGPRLHNRYLELALRVRKRELSDSAPQSAQKNINLETLRPLLIPVPPLDEQEAIAEIAASASDRIENECAVVAERRRLKAALADALLTGKIRVPETQTV